MERPAETNPPSAVNRLPAENGEPFLGGADAVEKTTYLDDVHGAGVNDADASRVNVGATVPHRGELGPLRWVLLALAALVIIAYAAGLFT